MATLSRKDRGAWLIQFFDQNKKRRPIHLGKKYNEKTARELKEIVEKIIYHRDNSLVPDKKTQTWIQEASPEIRDKLAAVGLIEKPPTHTVKELWDTFIEKKTDVKDTTMTTYTAAKDRFFLFFEGKELIADLTPARMRLWKEYLRTQAPCEGAKVPGLAESTVAGTIAKAKAVFNWSVQAGWLVTSPLDGVGRGSFVNEDKDRFITMDEYARLLDACPCSDWRVIIALARIGGLRCPSEVLRLKWSDINWNLDQFDVTSPKTERYKGKKGRWVPLFPALRSELESLFFKPSSEGTEYVINRYRDPERTNLGTQFGRIVQLAGIEPVKRPFDNMRASRSTEIYAEHGAFLESQWIGHSSKIAKDHYLQVREEDFERATQSKTAVEAAPNSEFTVKRHAFTVGEKSFTVKSTVTTSGNGGKIAEVKKTEKAIKP